MAKRVELTESISSAIRNAVGDDIDFSKIAVFEAEIASTRAISQKYSPYDGARLSERYLNQMVEYLAEETVPLQVMHENHYLPVGKVFQADTFASADGETALNALFYVKSDSQYAEDIELGITDEVSIGAVPKHALCSECGFDYVESGNEMSFYYQECDEGHHIGEEGVHLRVTSLEQWKELSLVNKGASSKAKILGSAQRRLSAEEFKQLAAASGSPLSAQLSYLSCSPNNLPTPDNEETPMELKALSDQIAQLSADKTRFEVKTETLESQLTAQGVELSAATTKVEELTVELAASGDAVLTEKLASIEAELALAKEGSVFLAGQYKLACTATSMEFKEDATVSEMIGSIETAQVKLAAIPRNGAFLSADSGTKTVATEQSYAANAAFVN